MRPYEGGQFAAEIPTVDSILLPDIIDWTRLQGIAEHQGLLAVAMDGIERIPLERRPKKKDIIQWVGKVIQQESQYAVKDAAAEEMALLFHNNVIRTYVLKGAVVAECYPNPVHRNSADMDCYLMPDQGEFDAWALGNDLEKAKGVEVRFDYYKNSTIHLPGLMVENHRFIVPFRGNEVLTKLEKELQGYMENDRSSRHLTEERRFEGTWLYRPPVMVSALFLIEHAYSHFLHEGLTWRLVLDWMMFSQKHQDDIDWNRLDAKIDEFGFRKFFDSYLRLGKYLVGEIKSEDLNSKDRRMLDDVWADLDLHESKAGFKGKMNLVGNTLRARWKYRHFSDISMVHALWIQAKGVLFSREPRLND